MDTKIFERAVVEGEGRSCAQLSRSASPSPVVAFFVAALTAVTACGGRVSYAELSESELVEQDDNSASGAEKGSGGAAASLDTGSGAYGADTHDLGRGDEYCGRGCPDISGSTSGGTYGGSTYYQGSTAGGTYYQGSTAGGTYYQGSTAGGTYYQGSTAGGTASGDGTTGLGIGDICDRGRPC